MKSKDSDIRSMASFAFDKRSYVHTPRSILNRNTRRGSKFRDRRQHEEIGDLYQAQRIENVVKKTERTKRIPVARMSSTLWQNEKLRLDIQKVAHLRNEIQEYSARYRERMLIAQSMVRPRSRVPTGQSPETVDMQKWKDEGKRLKHRFIVTRQATDKMMVCGITCDSRRTEFQRGGQFEAKTQPSSRPQSRARMHGVQKRKNIPKLSALDMCLDGQKDGLVIQSAYLSPRAIRNESKSEQPLFIVNSKVQSNGLMVMQNIQ